MSLDQVGPRLRAARLTRGWTLDELARRASVSASTLSRLESGKRQASLELLVPLTRLLGVTLDDLVAAPTPDPRVRRPAQHRHGMEIVPLTPTGSPVETFRVTFSPQRELPDLRVHDGYEWLYVLAGRLRLRLGDQDLVLVRGEAAQFDTRTPHALSAAGGRPVTVLSIFDASGARIHTYGDEPAQPSA